MVHADVNTLVANMNSSSAADQAQIYLQLALHLRDAGADTVVC